LLKDRHSLVKPSGSADPYKNVQLPEGLLKDHHPLVKPSGSADPLQECAASRRFDERPSSAGETFGKLGSYQKSLEQMFDK
jgi:hypothetical protein